MEINGKIYCMFEQSGTFKTQFQKMGFEALDIDIKNGFGQTDIIIDLFSEIVNAYDGKPSIFDRINKNDLIIAFYPCIYFSCFSQINMNLNSRNYRKLTNREKFEKILERAHDREYYFSVIAKMVFVCVERGLRLIIENPYSQQCFLKGNFVLSPSFIDNDRTKMGDYFKKPTAYWFVNCEPTKKRIFCIPVEKIKRIEDCRKAQNAGECSMDRSLISPEYAKNFILSKILGDEEKEKQLTINFI